MASRRRNGAFVSAAVTEAARRQLMSPVPCWELQWCTPDCVATGSSLKVYKWVVSNKLQQFSDDEEEIDDTLAPLPDEPDVVEGEEEEQEEEGAKVESQIQSREVSEPHVPATDAITAPPTPRAHPLSVSLVAGEEEAETEETGDSPPVPTLTLEVLEGSADENLEVLDHDMADASLGLLTLNGLDDQENHSFEVVDPMQEVDGDDSLALGDDSLNLGDDILAGLPDESMPSYAEEEEEEEEEGKGG